jgi:ferredoxin-like protein FixX
VRLPSIKTLRAVFDDKAPEARRILEMSRAELEALPAGAARVAECYGRPDTVDLRMSCLDALGCGTFGVESFETTKRDWRTGAPEVCEYLNTGDTYAPTLINFCGRYRVASWGDIAERWT